MEHFETQAIATAPTPPLVWYRYVDDTFVVIRNEQIEGFTNHINSLDNHIKFTSEPESDSKLAFLDTLITRKPDGSLKTTIYRKPTHTDQYLSYESNHLGEHKLSVIKTLFHRAETIVTEEEDLKLEKGHITKALKNCGYPKVAFKKASIKKPPRERNSTTHETHGPSLSKPLPYIKGVTEPIRRYFQEVNAKSYVKSNNKIGEFLVHPKDKSHKKDIAGPVYLIPCQGDQRHECNESYIGETERTLSTRFLEHRRPSSASSSEVAAHLHVESPGHKIDLDSVKILDKDTNWRRRGIKEAIYIRRHQPTLNQDGGRYRLAPIWNSLLADCN